MYTLTVTNQNNETLALTQNINYTVINIDGLNPPVANIGVTTNAQMDGARVNTATVGVRNIVITIVINPEIEKNRIGLYRYFASKRKVRIDYANGIREVYIEGIVEAVEISLFENSERAQVSILCPEPFFKAMKEIITNFRSVLPQFLFAFNIEESGIPFSAFEAVPIESIENNGDIASGCVIELRILMGVSNPKIYNVDDNTYFILDNIELDAGDLIIINTNKRNKGVTLTRQGVKTNIINKMRRGSTWFQLEVGNNTFSYEVDGLVEGLECVFIHNSEFEGV